MQRQFRRAFTSIKEHAHVSYAKMATAGGFCDLQFIVVKATSPDDIPLPDRYVHDLLRIFSISPTSLRAFALFFSRRFGKTRCWRVALKCLILLHRLLLSSPDDTSLRNELLWARTHRFMTLYPCDFVDRTSTSSSEEYTIFVRSYARFLDEALECFSINEVVEKDCYGEIFAHEGRNLWSPGSHTLIKHHCETQDLLSSHTLTRQDLWRYGEILYNRMKELRGVLEALQQLQSLIDRVMECRPAAGAAERSLLVRSAMKHIIRESFACYSIFEEEVVGVLENMIQMSYRNCVAAFSIYKKAAAQGEELSEFYEWCKCMGLCGAYEYPLVGRIPQIQIRALENFLNGMWGLSDSPPTGSTVSVPEGEEEEAGKHGDEFDGKEMWEKLIDLEGDGNSASWEELLDASISMPCIASNNFS